jgi:prepilin-type N-terminal cleavage/methylation domain-containing protein
MKIRKNAKGFTLVEIMIVVAIIGLLAAIAVPNFVQARTTARTNACINNMRLIDAAKEQDAIENNQAAGAVATNVLDYLKGNVLPICPAGSAAYVVGNIGAVPTCGNVGTNATHIYR